MRNEEETKAVLERWREVDMAVTDALNEAKDNVRFLGNLRKVKRAGRIISEWGHTTFNHT